MIIIANLPLGVGGLNGDVVDVQAECRRRPMANSLVLQRTNIIQSAPRVTRHTRHTVLACPQKRKVKVQWVAGRQPSVETQGLYGEVELLDLGEDDVDPPEQERHGLVRSTCDTTHRERKRTSAPSPRRCQRKLLIRDLGGTCRSSWMCGEDNIF